MNSSFESKVHSLVERAPIGFSVYRDPSLADRNNPGYDHSQFGRQGYYEGVINTRALSLADTASAPVSRYKRGLQDLRMGQLGDQQTVNEFLNKNYTGPWEGGNYGDRHNAYNQLGVYERIATTDVSSMSDDTPYPGQELLSLSYQTILGKKNENDASKRILRTKGGRISAGSPYAVTAVIPKSEAIDIKETIRDRPELARVYGQAVFAALRQQTGIGYNEVDYERLDKVATKLHIADHIEEAVLDPSQLVDLSTVIRSSKAEEPTREPIEISSSANNPALPNETQPPFSRGAEIRNSPEALLYVQSELARLVVLTEELASDDPKVAAIHNILNGAHRLFTNNEKL